MTSSPNKQRARDQRRLNIRMSEQELAQLKKDAEALGQSIQSTMKKIYFKASIYHPVFDKDGTDRVLAALSQIGNNMNQIAKKLNTGFAEGFHSHLTEALEGLQSLKAFVGGFYGHN